MRKVRPYLYLLLMAFTAHTSLYSQNTIPDIPNIPDRTLRVLDRQYAALQQRIRQQTEKILLRMQKKEAALQQQLQPKDSLKARVLFTRAQATYQQWLTRLQTPVNTSSTADPLREYIPGVDSMQTALRFLGQSHLSPAKLQQVQAAGSQLQQLQGTLQQATDIRQFIGEREQQLKTQLSGSGFTKQLLGINKESYYYQQQLAGYKDLLNNRDRLKEQVLSQLSQQRAFQDFMQQHSYLSRLFGHPATVASPTGTPPAGLQTKAQLQQLIGQHTGVSITGSGGGSQQFMQQQLQQAQQQLSQLQDKVTQLASKVGSPDLTLPDFSPNEQKTRSFLNRLEFGFTIQSQAGNYWLPGSSTLALSVGYRLNDRSAVGIGGSYIMGLGSGLDHIALSNLGIGMRSYLEEKLKGSIWLTGEIDYNYMQAFQKWSQVDHLDVWQQGALIGLSKKYRLTGRKTGTLQVLYDALYRQHIPATQPILFRTGLSF